MKLEDVNPREREGAIVNEEGEVLCPKCKKEPAWVTWGHIGVCWTCERPNIKASLDEHGKRKCY